MRPGGSFGLCCAVATAMAAAKEASGGRDQCLCRLCPQGAGQGGQRGGGEAGELPVQRHVQRMVGGKVDQATDRAYRIGQKNVVQVFKLVAKGTIEEKILVMQERKRALIDSLIQPGENFIGKMAEAEIRALFGE